MGGLGSGGHNSKGRSRVEGCHYLDASRVKQFGLLTEGASSTLIWRDENGKPLSTIHVQGGRDQIRLDYKWRRGHGPWTQHEEPVAIDWHKRHLGGEQPYFLCPRCSSRVKRLYSGARYLCRTCHNLVYASTQERPGDRAMRRSRKLRRKVGAGLGMDDPFGPRPKGMHTKTYDRIVKGVIAAEDEVHDDLIRILARLERTEHPFWSRSGRGRSSPDFWS